VKAWRRATQGERSFGASLSLGQRQQATPWLGSVPRLGSVKTKAGRRPASWALCPTSGLALRRAGRKRGQSPSCGACCPRERIQALRPAAPSMQKLGGMSTLVATRRLEGMPWLEPTRGLAAIRRLAVVELLAAIRWLAATRTLEAASSLAARRRLRAVKQKPAAQQAVTPRERASPLALVEQAARRQGEAPRSPRQGEGLQGQRRRLQRTARGTRAQQEPAVSAAMLRPALSWRASPRAEGRATDRSARPWLPAPTQRPSLHRLHLACLTSRLGARSSGPRKLLDARTTRPIAPIAAAHVPSPWCRGEKSGRSAARRDHRCRARRAQPEGGPRRRPRGDA
jgi:hypothetical protein